MHYLLMGLSMLLTLPCVWLAIMALNLFKRRKPHPKAAPQTRFAVIIPARNEARVVGNLIRSLHTQDYPADRFDVFVAVNNCTDDTEAVARACGAKILRCEGVIRSKGDVLHQAFERLLDSKYDAYAVFDADNIADSSFLQRMNDALTDGERVCRGRLKAGNATESWVAGNFGLYHVMMEWFYSRPHTIAGLSSNLVGTAFVVHREVMETLGGWNTYTICEDTEFDAQCIMAGYRIAFIPEALSYDEQVARFGLSMRQRFRWCRGMVEAARGYTKQLLSRECKNRRAGFDFAVMFIISHTAPLAMIFSLLSLPFQPRLMLAITGAGLILGALGMMLAAAFLWLLGGYPAGKMLPTVVTFPIFMVSWMPLYVLALLRPCRQWEAIPHNGQAEAHDEEPLAKEA